MSTALSRPHAYSSASHCYRDRCRAEKLVASPSRPPVAATRHLGHAGRGWYDGHGFTLLEGTGELPLYVCAEAPGEWEAEETRPLSPNGASGKVFRRALRENGISSRIITIGNILQCRPPDNELRGMPYAAEAIETCTTRHLNRHVAERQPSVFLALGDTALQALAKDPPGSVTAMRGFLLPSVYEGSWVVATYHPSFIARGQWQLYGAFKSDMAFAIRCARDGVPTPMETNYELSPTPEAVGRYLRHLLDNRLLPVSYDIETAHILGEPESADWREKRIIQIQFSSAAGTAIVFPWTDEFIPVAKDILATANPKWGWNSRLSDDLALEAAGCAINGERHDLMNAWGHLQPGYWGGKDDKDTDKGVPSRLMGLQSATSFYAPEVGPWKHLSADPDNLPLYGAMDADYTYRCGEGIMRDLAAFDLLDGYRTHKLELRPVLDYLGEVGLPVDREKQAELRAYVMGELERIQTAIQQQIPAEITGIHPKAGYKTTKSKIAYASDPAAKIALAAIVEQQQASEPQLVMAAGHTGYLQQRLFAEPSKDIVGAFEHPEPRWCIQRLFNPHPSSPNTKAYIRHMGYRMPKRLDDPDKDTTGKAELKKLADETGDPVLQLIHDWRDIVKIGLDYTGGAWVPGEDGRVHATFKWGTASGQLVAVAPAVMTYPEHSEIAKRAKEAIAAQPGHTLVKVDMRGFHSRMIGWLANDAAYYKLADFDVHSFITAHFLHLHDAPYLLDMDDDELRGALEAIKRAHTFERNFKVKRTVHGRQFNMGVNKLYTMHAQNFDPPAEDMMKLLGETRWHGLDRTDQVKAAASAGRREARTLFDLFDRLFPRTFVVYPETVANQLRNITRWRLRSPFAHHRFFWDYDKEQSTAFGPSNCAHCHIQAALVRMWRSGALQRFEFCNFTHDAGWFHPLDTLVAECIATVQHEFELPSTMLVDSPLGPFQCNSDAEVGPDLAHMTAWKG